MWSFLQCIAGPKQQKAGKGKAIIQPSLLPSLLRATLSMQRVTHVWATECDIPVRRGCKRMGACVCILVHGRCCEDVGPRIALLAGDCQVRRLRNVRPEPGREDASFAFEKRAARPPSEVSLRQSWRPWAREPNDRRKKWCGFWSSGVSELRA